MCFYGGCRSHTCENCKPKLVICPHCGKKSFLWLDICIYCKEAISKEIKQAAIDKWYVEKEKAIESQS